MPASGSGTVLDPLNLLEVNRDHLAWLEAKLTTPFTGRTFVVTHHAPHPLVAGPIEHVSRAFVSGFGAAIGRYQPDAWLFGHTRRWLAATVGRTLIRNVSLGYPREVDPKNARSLLLRGWIEEGRLKPAEFARGILRVFASKSA